VATLCEATFPCPRFPAIVAHRIATHLAAVGIVNQAAEDAISQCRIADLFVPT